MPVRKTERSLPFNITAEDVGQHVTSTDGKTILFGFNQNPVVKDRKQTFAIFVTDNSLADQVETFEWQIDNTGTSQTLQSNNGYLRYQPDSVGQLTVQATLKGSAGQTLESVTLQLDVTVPNPELEAIYNQSGGVGPLAGQPETSREIINDIRAYIDELAPRDADPDSTLNKLVFAIAYARAIQVPEETRARQLEEIANSLDDNDASTLMNRTREGLGTCGLRPHVLAMYLNEEGTETPLIAKTQFPAAADARFETENGSIDALTSLAEQVRIDLFNVMRFPKLNLKMAIHLIEALREEFFSGETLNVVVSDRAKGTKLLDQFINGPVVNK